MRSDLGWVLGMQVLAVLLCLGFLVNTNPLSRDRVAAVTDLLQRVEQADTDQERLDTLPTLGTLLLNRANATRAARRSAAIFSGGMAVLLICNTILIWRLRHITYSNEAVEIRTL